MRDITGPLDPMCIALMSASCVAQQSVGTRPLAVPCRYSLLAGGKRVRPALCLAAAELVGGTIEQVRRLHGQFPRLDSTCWASEVG